MSKGKTETRDISRLRNIGIIAHIDAGKTTLTERFLYYAGRIHRMGEVHDGTATMDFMPEEQERGITIASACTTCFWDNNQINIIDTPGHVDFTIEVERSLRVLDGAVGVFCGVSGVEPQSETVWRQSERYGVPKLGFINKLDRLGADFETVLESMKSKLGATPLPLTIPAGQGDDFSGVFDLLSRELVSFDQNDNGITVTKAELDEQDRNFVEEWRDRSLEILAEVDEEFLELYLSGNTIPLSEIRKAIRRATLSREITPVFCGSALKNTGVQLLMDGVTAYLPSPIEAPAINGRNLESSEAIQIDIDASSSLVALAFKVIMDGSRKQVLLRLYAGCIDEGDQILNVTQDRKERAARMHFLHAHRQERVSHVCAGDIVAITGLKFAKTGDTLCGLDNKVLLESIEEYKPVISVALEAANSEEEERLEDSLSYYLMEDPTLVMEKDEDTGQLILSGMGELHLEVVLDRLRREYKVSPRVGNPQVVYQETLSDTTQGEFEFDRALGEKHHYGYVGLVIEPRDRGKGNDVVFEVNSEEWPEPFVDAVVEGVMDALNGGVLSGYPIADVRVRIVELKGHEKNQSDVGFRMAATNALREALQKGKTKLLEPIMNIDISVPDDFVGDVICLLGSKGAKIDNMFDRSGQKIVTGLAPLRQLFGFSTALRSATQGRAGLMMNFSRFDVLE